MDTNNSTVSKYIAAIMALVTVGSFARAAFDNVGWRLWEVISVAPEIRTGIAREFIFNFVFTNALVLVVVWAICSSAPKSK